MNFLSTCSAPVTRRWLTAAAVVVAFGSATSAQAQFLEGFRPGSIYAASSLGLMYTTAECNKAPTCEHPRIGGKMFGGYRFTPSLAAEVGFYYLGKFNASQGANYVASPSLPTATSLHDRAVSYGFDWSNEMFGVMRQHIRFGIARVTTSGTESYGGALTSVYEHATVPYLGLGLSYQFNPNVRFYSGYDILRNRRNDHIHMFSMGLGVEN